MSDLLLSSSGCQSTLPLICGQFSGPIPARFPLPSTVPATMPMASQGNESTKKNSVKRSPTKRGVLVLESLESRNLLAADPIISEFMADNGSTLNDGYGASSDWIEIHNQGDAALDLSGYSLTDDLLDPNKWVFPGRVLNADEYLVVFASGDNVVDPGGDPLGYLHTNFKLSASGEYLALLDPSGVTVSEYGAGGASYPAQVSDISYGTSMGAIGSLISPTPGASNTAVRANDVVFSHEGGAFPGLLSLTLSTSDPTETIRYTTDGSIPTTGSAVYTAPLTLGVRTQITARAYGASGQIGTPRSETYTPTDTATNSFTSDLPIVVIEHFSQGVPGTSNWEDSAFTLYDVDPLTGRASIASPSDISMEMGLQRRGSSTAGNPKTNYRLELRDPFGEDQSVSLLGMPADSDWILYAPYSFDRAMVRDTFFFELSNEIGHYSPRTRFVEVFANTNNGTLQESDYMGTYVLMENVKRGAERVDISKLSASDNSGSEVTGGYIIKIDRTDGAPDGAWTSDRGNPTADANNFFVHYEPERADMTQAQVDYIRDYINDFETALYGPNSTDPVLGYEAFFDVDASIDYHIVKTLSKDPDALRLSTYLVKDKDGKLAFGPQWDFDRSAGPDGDGRAASPYGWDANEAPFFGYDWWGELFADPDFMQRWVDRWQELRATELSDVAIAARIDAQADQIAESSVRNFTRWSNVAPNGGSFADPGLSGWEAEVSHFKNWVIARAQWMDTQMVTAPAISPASSNVAPNAQVVLTPNHPDDAIYYTLDGTDPRAEGGGIAAQAMLYTGPLTVDTTLSVTARSSGIPTTGGGYTSNSSYPSNEAPIDAIDNSGSTKYLNFGEENSGIIISTGASTVRSIRLTTANDAVERDPASYALYGTNQAIASTDNSTGMAEDWTLISSGSLSLPNARNTEGPLVSFSNSTSYASYKLMFPTVKNAGSANSMQIAEISFHSRQNGNGGNLISPNDPVLAVHAESNNSTADGLSPWSEAITGVFAAAIPADASNLRITEMQFHPADPTTDELTALPLIEDDDFEFIELTNVGSETISLVGVQFDLGITFDFNTSNITTLAPGETIVLVEDMQAFALRYGTTGISIGGQYSGNLANGGEAIRLVDAAGLVIHDFVYDDIAPWPVAADGSGPSMEIVDVDGDYGDPLNWHAASSAPGTPGVIPGDFDSDGRLTCSDIDMLNGVAVAGSDTPGFDLNGDGVVDADDVARWVESLRATALGDANLDQALDALDFAAWNANRFTNTTSYCGGDFNTDGIADVSDFNLWLQSRDAIAAAAAAASAAVAIDGAATPMDVNADGVISPVDALQIINHLNASQQRAFTANLDVNADQLISPIDALLVINHLNASDASPHTFSSRSIDAVFEEDDEDKDADASSDRQDSREVFG